MPYEQEQPMPKIGGAPLDPDQSGFIFCDAGSALPSTSLANKGKQDMLPLHETSMSSSAVAKQFRYLLDQQTVVCAELEKIADDLPELSDRHSCLDLANRMLPLIKRAHQFEEARVWPMLSQQTAATFELRETLDRLSYEHWGDEDFAEQIFHLLKDYVRCPLGEKADNLAWTLRGFFQNLQRHIAFEREFLLPLVSMDAQ